MEVRQLLSIQSLSLTLTLKPTLKSTEGVLREDTAVVNLHHTLDNLAHRLKAEGGIYHRGYNSSYATDKVGICQCKLTEAGTLGAMLDAGTMDNVANAHL